VLNDRNIFGGAEDEFNIEMHESWSANSTFSFDPIITEFYGTNPTGFNDINYQWYSKTYEDALNCPMTEGIYSDLSSFFNLPEANIPCYKYFAIWNQGKKTVLMAGTSAASIKAVYAIQINTVEAGQIAIRNSPGPYDSASNLQVIRVRPTDNLAAQTSPPTLDQFCSSLGIQNLTIIGPNYNSTLYSKNGGYRIQKLFTTNLPHVHRELVGKFRSNIFILANSTIVDNARDCKIISVDITYSKDCYTTNINTDKMCEVTVTSNNSFIVSQSKVIDKVDSMKICLANPQTNNKFNLTICGGTNCISQQVSYLDYAITPHNFYNDIVEVSGTAYSWVTSPLRMMSEKIWTGVKDKLSEQGSKALVVFVNIIIVVVSTALIAIVIWISIMGIPKLFSLTSFLNKVPIFKKNNGRSTNRSSHSEVKINNYKFD